MCEQREGGDPAPPSVSAHQALCRAVFAAESAPTVSVQQGLFFHQAPRPSPWSRGFPTCAVLEEDADAEVLRRIWKGRRGPGLSGEEQHARGHLLYPRSSRVLLTRPTPAHPRSDPRRHSLGDCNRHMYKMSTRAHTCTHVYNPVQAHRPHCPWEHRPAPAQHSQETLSCTVLSVVTRLPRYCTRQVRLVPWSWGLGVRNNEGSSLQGV